MKEKGKRKTEKKEKKVGTLFSVVIFSVQEEQIFYVNLTIITLYILKLVILILPNHINPMFCNYDFVVISTFTFF